MTNEEFEPIRIRIMQEAYDLADRNDTEGYNSVKVMCSEVQNLIQRPWVGLTNDEFKQCSYDADGFTIDREVAMRAVESKLKEKNK